MGRKTTSVVIGSTILILGALIARDNQAQTPAAPAAIPIGVVDLVKVFNDFEQTKALNDELTRYKRELADKQQKKEEQIRVERDTVQGFAPDSAEYRKRAQALKKMMIEFQAEMAVEEEMLKDEHRHWIERTYDTITKCIAGIAKRRGLQLVLTREELETNVEDATVLQRQILNRKVVYSDPGLDMTAEVLVTLNDGFAKAGGAKSVKLGP